MAGSYRDIDPYVRIVFYTDGVGLVEEPQGYVRRGAIVDFLREGVAKGLDSYRAKLDRDRPELIEQLFYEFIQYGAIVEEADPIAGSYFRISSSQIAVAKHQFLKESEIFARSEKIGALTFFNDVFQNFSEQIDPDSLSAPSEVPASDRIVTLNHNQISELDLPLTAIIENLERDNGVPDSPGIKERLLGQIKAGREMINAGSFRAYLLYSTLLKGLVELAARYKDAVIGAAAGKLVELLIAKIFEGPV